ncbi:MAG: hypothetical protein MSA65_02785 [Mollicutes bacterium]|nr:hypothetical protein [Mollicutes bacterium]
MKNKDKIIHLTSILNDNIFKVLNDNECYKKELEDTKKMLYNALLKLDRIKLITNDKEILKILEEL